MGGPALTENFKNVFELGKTKVDKCFVHGRYFFEKVWLVPLLEDISLKNALVEH